MKYKMNWSKAYYMNGTAKIIANSPEEAIEEMDKIIGDQTGSMQYHPDDNVIEVDSEE